MKNDSVKMKNFLYKSMDKLQVIIVFLLMFIFMAVTMPSFLSYLNITNLLKQNAVNFVLGAAMTSVLIMGEIDISVGAVVGLTVTAAGTLCAHGFSLIECLLACIFIGLFVGLINGLLITRGGLPSFIATLGTQMMCRSLAYVLTGGKVITTFPEGWTWIGQETILGNFPISFFFVILLYIITYIMHKRTAIGQKMYAVGSNHAAATLSGININRVKMFIMMYSGLLAGIAGVLLSSRTPAAQGDAGLSTEFYVIAGAVIGGTSMSGGKGNVLLTMIGVFIIGMIRNALNLSHIDAYWQNFVIGAVIVAAVLLDCFRQRLQKKMEV